MVVLYMIWGLFVGAMVGLTAVGVGLVGTPGLMLLFGMEDLVAVGTMSFCGIFMQMASAVSHLQQGNVDWRVSVAFGATALPVSFWAASTADVIAQHINFKMLMGAVVIAAVAAMLFGGAGSKSRPGPGDRQARWRLYVAPVAGVFSGFLVGATSISGSIIVLACIFCLRMPLRVAVGTTAFISAPSLLLGTLGHGMEGRIDWGAVWGLLPGVVVGAVAGSLLVKRLPAKALRIVMMVVLGAAGVWITLKGLMQA